MEKEIRLIVRIANKDLNGKVAIARALMGLKGISQRTGRILAQKFIEEAKIGANTKLGEIPEEMDRKLEDIILNPGKHGVPSWCLNRRKDFETGEDSHKIMGELDFSLRKDLQRLSKIKSYRGLRLGWGLTVRGQKTKSTHRGKGGVIGVIKKEIALKMKAAPAAEKKEEKKK
ncbi:MAG: 30S ribosomal protein S13 [Candidatus Diapherotrites archaeon]